MRISTDFLQTFTLRFTSALSLRFRNTIYRATEIYFTPKNVYNLTFNAHNMEMTITILSKILRFTSALSSRFKNTIYRLSYRDLKTHKCLQYDIQHTHRDDKKILKQKNFNWWSCLPKFICLIAWVITLRLLVRVRTIHRNSASTEHSCFH